MLSNTEIKAMTPRQQLKLLRLILNNCDVVITACYGEAETATKARLAKKGEHLGRGETGTDRTLVIDTNIMTG